MSRITRDNIINFVLLHGLWPACVLGAARDMLWVAMAYFVAYAIWELARSHMRIRELVLMGVMGIAGTISDSLYIQLGVITFSMPVPSAEFAPVWITMLWMGLALSMSRCLGWLRGRYLLAALLGALASPLSYYMGCSLGAGELGEPVRASLLVLAAGWAVMLPLSAWMASRLVGSREVVPSSPGSTRLTEGVNA